MTLVEDTPQARDGPLQIDTRLKYDFSGSTPILIVPQPTDDPNDPLVCNFPLSHIGEIGSEMMILGV